MPKHKLICCIVDHTKGSRVLKIARKHNVKSGTIFIGKGTVKNRILELLDLNDSRKEIVILGAESSLADNAVKQISKELAFHKPGHGIAFTLPLEQVFGTRTFAHHNEETTTEGSHMYHAIITIVEKGIAADVISAANEAGARGGTIIHARGSGVHETQVLFAMPIEPEKEIVLIIAETSLTEPITNAIREAVGIDEPGKGIILVSGIEEVFGLFK